MPVDEDKIRVTAIQRLCVHDGPGVRTTVFLKGCYLQCPWCCNPETIHYADDYLYDKGICIEKSTSSICKDCALAGGKRLKKDCPLHAYEPTYTDYEADTLFALLMRDEPIYRTDGGVTFSGGEPLFQVECLFPLIQKLKEAGVHIVFESSVFAPLEHLELVWPYVDNWLIDLKFQYGYVVNKESSSIEIAIDKNLEFIQSVVPRERVSYRMVIMGEIMSRLDRIIQKLKCYQIDRIELLSYHYLGENKYRELNRPFHRFTCLDRQTLEGCVSLLEEKGIKASYLKI